MAQGCTGNTPEPIACCPLNSFGNAVDPNPATENCIAGYEPGSIWENSTDGSFWIMTACPDTWQCISGCEDGLYFLRVVKNDDVELQTFDTGVQTPVWFGASGSGAPDYEYPSGLSQWQVGVTAGKYDTFNVPYNGIYRITWNYALNLKGATLNDTSDFVTVILNNGVTEVGRVGEEIYNTTDNEFLYMKGSIEAEFTAGDNVTIRLEHDSGVACGVSGCDCVPANKPACIRSVNNVDTSPLFPTPRAGVLNIAQIR